MRHVNLTLTICIVFIFLFFSTVSEAQTDTDQSIVPSASLNGPMETASDANTNDKDGNTSETTHLTKSPAAINPVSPKIADTETQPTPVSPSSSDNGADVLSTSNNHDTHSSAAVVVEGPTPTTTSKMTADNSPNPDPSPKQPLTNNPFIALGDEMFLGIALITAWGTHFWDWWQQPFHFKKEHGFTQESSTGGADKTGHFFTGYIFADFLNWRLRKQGWSRLRSAIVGSSVAMGLVTWIEVGDATSEYGWSWEDMLADFIGVAVSAGLALSPTADELIDVRLEYTPTSSYLDGGVMAADYSGMKYLVALRMTGIKPLKATPLRFIEWHMGFYSRGFRSFDNAHSTNRVLYVGMGIDLKEIFDLFIPQKYKRPFDVAFTYYQVPYTSWTMKKWEHRSQPEPSRYIRHDPTEE